MRVDAHHHLWQVARGDYFWMDPAKDPALAVIARDFLPPDYAALAARHGIQASVVVQAAQTEAETYWLFQQARDSAGLVRGVVGWIDLASPDACSRLNQMAREPLLSGIRPMLQDLADSDWILRPELDPALRRVQELDLAFDLLIKPRHLPHALAFLRRYPSLRAVIDHGAKPAIGSGQWQPWADDMARLARETQALCKLSGLVTESGANWSQNQLKPYVDHVLMCFGPQRLMWGSDWPVALLASSYQRWLETAQGLIAHLTSEEQEAILGNNAMTFYRL